MTLTRRNLTKLVIDTNLNTPIEQVEHKSTSDSCETMLRGVYQYIFNWYSQLDTYKLEQHDGFASDS